MQLFTDQIGLNLKLIDKKAIEKMEEERDSLVSEIEAMDEEHGGDDGLMVEAKNDKDKITAASVKERLKKLKDTKADAEEKKLLEDYLKLSDKIVELNKTYEK